MTALMWPISFMENDPCKYVQRLQWNPSIMDTVETQHFVSYSEVSLTRTSGIFPVGMVLRELAVEYNMAALSELSKLSFAVCWQGRLRRG